MAQADGTILIDTEIDADGMKAGSKEVEAAVRRMASSVDDLGTKAKAALNKQVDSFVKLNSEFATQKKKVDDLKKKVAEYGSQKIPTDEYREIQAQIDQATKKMNQLIASQERYLNIGGKSGSSAYKKMQYDIDELANTIKYAEGELRDLENTGKAFTFGSQTKQAAADMEKLSAAERKLSSMNNRLGTSYSSIKGQVNDYKNSLLKTDAAQKKASASGNKLTKSLKDTGKSAKSANFGLGKMLGTSLLFSFVFQAISGVMNAMKEGFTNLAQYSGTTNNSISMLWSSLERLKNSLATAFAPILDVVAPILSKFIDMLSTAASYVSMFFAFLSGKSTYTRAVAVQKDYAASLADTAAGASEAADATDKAAEAAEGYLSPLDEINKMDNQESSSGNGGTGGGGGAGGSGTGPMFEEVEITDIPILENLKNILSDLFKPFKNAWEKEGQNTIDAAMFAFRQLGKLAKSIGKSFMKVWTNGTGEKMLTTILQILQDIFYSIGLIAQGWDEAWNTDDNGTRIIQGIADALNAILDIVHRLTSATREFFEGLDWTPLFSSLATLSEQLAPVITAVGDILLWLYETILLPIIGWLIEDALPQLIGILSQILEVIAVILDFISAYVLPVIEPIVSDLLELVMSLVSNMESFLSGFLDFLLGVFTGDWSRAFSGIQKMVQSLQNNILAIFDFIQHSILEPFSNFLSGIFSHDWSVTFGIFGDVLNGFLANTRNIWNSVRQIFDGIITFVRGVFSGNWRQAWNGIKEIFSGVFNSLRSIAKTPINGIIGIVNGAISGINTLIRGVNRLPYVNIPTISKIPYLASGAVIPPNKEFMAVLGDQKHGTNIETPEALLRKIMREELGRKQSVGGSYSFTAQINRRTLFEEFMKEAELQQMRTGKSPFEMA